MTAVAVGPSNAAVVAGLTLQFTATAMFSDGTQQDVSAMATWSSSAMSVATVSSVGVAKGVAAGSSSISAVWSGVTGTDVLTVAPPNLLSLVISPNKPTVPVGKDLQFSVIGSFTDGSSQDLTGSVTWNSSDQSVAQFSSDPSKKGQVTAAALGTTNIGASTGGVSATAVRMTVTATIYAYATNYDGDTVSQYVVSSDGSLTPLGSATVPAGHQPFSISMEPTGEYVYVSNFGSSSVSQYRIGDNGELTAIGTGTISTGAAPNAVTIDHADRYAYVANLGDSTLSQFKIGLDGALMPLTPATVASGNHPSTLIVDPSNRFAYAATFGINDQYPPPGPSTIYQYLVGNDGALTPMSTAYVATGSGPNSISIDPQGKYLYVVNLGDNNVGQYLINPDGTLTAMAVPTVATGARPFSVLVDRSGHYVYVANQNDATISQFKIGTDGSLSALTPGTVAAGTGVTSVTIDPTNKYLYATNRGTATISQYVIQMDGTLAPMASPTVASGLHPTAIAIGY